MPLVKNYVSVSAIYTLKERNRKKTIIGDLCTCDVLGLTNAVWWFQNKQRCVVMTADGEMTWGHHDRLTLATLLEL